MFFIKLSRLVKPFIFLLIKYFIHSYFHFIFHLIVYLAGTMHINKHLKQKNASSVNMPDLSLELVSIRSPSHDF